MNIMATNQTPAAKTAPAPKAKKPPVAVVTRLTDQMKRGALGGKLSADELDKLANLATSLKVFVSA
jgi:hypothetical protein